VGDRWSSFCTLDEHGDVCSQGRVATTPTGLQKHFVPLAQARVALEAGTHSAWISRLLEDCGHEVIVANPRELRKIYQSHRKNDRNDALTLARMARFDPRLLEPIQHRNAQMQADLAFVRARDTLVGTRTKCINSARCLVKGAGLRLPKCDADTFAKRVLPLLPQELAAALSPLIMIVQELTDKIRGYDSAIEELSNKSYPHTALLQQVGGVGPVTSLAYVLTIGDEKRFSNRRDIGAFFGLVPRQDDSGEHVSQLRISKSGNSYVRRLLVGCAQYILGRFGPDTDLRRYGHRLMERGGKNAKKRAVVAVARKLAVLLHRLWTTGEVYEPLRNTRNLSSVAA
jgi:transposase